MFPDNKRQINFNKSKNPNQSEIIETSRKERLKRQETLLKIKAATKIQSCFRMHLVARNDFTYNSVSQMVFISILKRCPVLVFDDIPNWLARKLAASYVNHNLSDHGLFLSFIQLHNLSSFVAPLLYPKLSNHDSCLLQDLNYPLFVQLLCNQHTTSLSLDPHLFPNAILSSAPTLYLSSLVTHIFNTTHPSLIYIQSLVHLKNHLSPIATTNLLSQLPSLISLYSSDYTLNNLLSSVLLQLDSLIIQRTIIYNFNHVISILLDTSSLTSISSSTSLPPSFHLLVLIYSNSLLVTLDADFIATPSLLSFLKSLLLYVYHLIKSKLDHVKYLFLLKHFYSRNVRLNFTSDDFWIIKDINLESIKRVDFIDDQDDAYNFDKQVLDLVPFTIPFLTRFELFNNYTKKSRLDSSIKVDIHRTGINN